MIRDSRPVFPHPIGPAVPMLVHCDTSGRVVSISEFGRRGLGIAPGLPEGLSSFLSAIYEHNLRKTGLLTIRFTRVIETGSGVVIALEAWTGGNGTTELAGLLGLNRSMLLHTVQLERVCRRLTARVARRGPGSGRRVVEQVELERQRVGRELHTGVGQLLAALRIQLELVQSAIPETLSSGREALERALSLSSQASEQVRAVSHRLHPPEWQRLAIADALTQLWEMSGIPQRFDGDLHIEPLSAEPVLAVKTLLYRSAQEALSNVVRHSGASRVAMTLRQEGPDVRLIVTDNGTGFDLDRILHGSVSLRSGIGLRSIREQSQAMNGAFQISGGPAGVTFDLRLPVAGEES